jgi:hypothetical protein
MNDMKRIKRVLPLTNATLLRKLNPEISQPGGHIKAAEEMTLEERISWRRGKVGEASHTSPNRLNRAR